MRDNYNVITPKVLRLILKEAETSRHYTAIYLLANTGMGLGELCALRINSINFEQSYLFITKTHTVIDKKVIETDPKTHAGMRTIHFSSQTEHVLKKHIHLLDKMFQMMYAVSWDNNTHLFCNEYAQPFNHSTIRNAFKGAVKKLGIPHMRVHDLRHAHATALLAARVNIKGVSERLGHADVATTLQLYGHVLPGQDQGAANAFEQIVESAATD